MWVLRAKVTKKNSAEMLKHLSLSHYTLYKVPKCINMSDKQSPLDIFAYEISYPETLSNFTSLENVTVT